MTFVMRTADRLSSSLAGRSMGGPLLVALTIGTSVAPLSPCAARDDGIWAIDVTDPVNPTRHHLHDEGGTSFEGLLLDGGDLHATAHGSGLRIFAVSNPSSFVERRRSPDCRMPGRWPRIPGGSTSPMASGRGS